MVIGEQFGVLDSDEKAGRFSHAASVALSVSATTGRARPRALDSGRARTCLTPSRFLNPKMTERQPYEKIFSLPLLIVRRGSHSFQSSTVPAFRAGCGTGECAEAVEIAIKDGPIPMRILGKPGRYEADLQIICLFRFG